MLPDPLRELDSRNPLVMTLDGVLSRAECERERERMEKAGPTAAPVSVSGGFMMRPDIRNNTRVMFDDVELARVLYERVRAQVPTRLEEDWELCGANERLRGYRYSEGQYFAPHFDGAFVRSGTERSLLTFIVYLSACEGGGHTGFLDLERSVEPQVGRALIFNHHLLHEGAVVTAGVKYALRTDLMYRRGGAP
jgi:predicted 2-oxoglutarate/Fe(II)-dependent dioxygenase YbiX